MVNNTDVGRECYVLSSGTPSFTLMPHVTLLIHVKSPYVTRSKGRCKTNDDRGHGRFAGVLSIFIIHREPDGSASI